MPDETNKPEEELETTAPPPESGGGETVPVYVERHELTTTLDELRNLINANKKAGDDRYAALEAKLTTPKPAEHKPEGETQDGATKVSKKEEKPSGGNKPRTTRRRLWHNPFDRA